MRKLAFIVLLVLGLAACNTVANQQITTGKEFIQDILNNEDSVAWTKVSDLLKDKMAYGEFTILADSIRKLSHNFGKKVYFERISEDNSDIGKVHVLRYKFVLNKFSTKNPDAFVDLLMPENENGIIGVALKSN
jgi:hypothetical protein